MSNGPGFGAVAPILACNDVLATAYWYRDVLGFSIDEKYTNEGWGMLWAEGSQVFLSKCPKLVETAKGQQLLIACRDVDAIYARHKAHSAKIVSPLQTQPWGLREYTVEDPNGYHLRFQTWVGSDGWDGPAKITPSFTQAQPAFRVADLDASLRFYETLGFEAVYRNENIHLVMKRNSVTLHLSTEEGEGKTCCQIIVTGVNDLYDDLTGKGVKVVHEVGDRPWGNRDFTISDPDGNEITFSDIIDDDED